MRNPIFALVAVVAEASVARDDDIRCGIEIRGGDRALPLSLSPDLLIYPWDGRKFVILGRYAASLPRPQTQPKRAFHLTPLESGLH